MVIDVVGYLNTPETMRRQELEFGLVREPPSALFGHQSVLFRLAVAMDEHVRPGNLGTVIVSPMDVVLDRERSLVLQPDIIFISRRRHRIIRGQIWGAPDLVVEVLSPGTAERDRTAKVRWYREYRRARVLAGGRGRADDRRAHVRRESHAPPPRRRLARVPLDSYCRNSNWISTRFSGDARDAKPRTHNSELGTDPGPRTRTGEGLSTQDGRRT